MSTLAKRLNASLNLTGKLAVLTGGSQGIGGGAAVRFAEAGSSVIVVGRNEQLMAGVIDRCKAARKANPDAAGSGSSSETIYEYIKADLSVVSGIKQAIKDIEKVSKGNVNYLVETQGGPPNGRWQETQDGIDSHFAVQILSRYAIVEALASKGILKEAWVNVCAPGGSQKTFDIEDIDCRSYRNKNFFSLMMAVGLSHGLLTDTYTKALQSKYPQIGFYHVFPGIVTTNGASNRGFPFPLPQLFALSGPIISRTIGNSIQSYADIPVLLAANESAEKKELIAKEGHFLGATLKGANLAPWALDPDNQKRVVEKLNSYMA